jgi:hypothetical protein
MGNALLTATPALRHSRFLAKARPEEDFRYFSNAKACFSSENAT